MTFKTILVHVDSSRHAPARIRLAAGLARVHGAHLVGAAMTGISSAVFPAGYVMQPGTLEDSCFGALGEIARSALDQFDGVAAGFGIARSTELICDLPDAAMARLARFADLVVVGQDDPDEAPAGSVVRLPDAVVLNCARPVLVAPRHAPPERAIRKIVLAWDGSKEASFAMSGAVPLLRQAEEVSILALGVAGRDDAAAPADLARATAYLGRHHVRAIPLVLPAGHDAGRTLLATAKELDGDLLVMGCYGHSRLRELCLGGPSRTVLAEAELPVLLAH